MEKIRRTVNFSLLILALILIGTLNGQEFIPDFTKNPDGTGGVPPGIKHYLGVSGGSGTQGVPGDAHAVHGLVTKDGAGYIVCGKGNERGETGSSIDGLFLESTPALNSQIMGSIILELL